VAALFQAEALDALGVLLAGLRADALQRIDAIQRPALGADRTIRPDDAFQLREGRFFVAEMVGVQDGMTNSSLFSEGLGRPLAWVCQADNTPAKRCMANFAAPR
jgi:hypothetical protein